MSSWVKILNKKKTKQTKLLTLDLIALLNQNYCHKPQNCSPSARSYRQRKVKTPFPTHPILPKLPCTRALYLQGNAMQHSTEKKTKKKRYVDGALVTWDTNIHHENLLHLRESERVRNETCSFINCLASTSTREVNAYC